MRKRARPEIDDALKIDAALMELCRRAAAGDRSAAEEAVVILTLTDKTTQKTWIKQLAQVMGTDERELVRALNAAQGIPQPEAVKLSEKTSLLLTPVLPDIGILALRPSAGGGREACAHIVAHAEHAIRDGRKVRGFGHFALTSAGLRLISITDAEVDAEDEDAEEPLHLVTEYSLVPVLMQSPLHLGTTALRRAAAGDLPTPHDAAATVAAALARSGIHRDTSELVAVAALNAYIHTFARPSCRVRIRFVGLEPVVAKAVARALSLLTSHVSTFVDVTIGRDERGYWVIEVPPAPSARLVFAVENRTHQWATLADTLLLATVRGGAGIVEHLPAPQPHLGYARHVAHAIKRGVHALDGSAAASRRMPLASGVDAEIITAAAEALLKSDTNAVSPKSVVLEIARRRGLELVEFKDADIRQYGLPAYRLAGSVLERFTRDRRRIAGRYRYEIDPGQFIPVLEALGEHELAHKLRQTLRTRPGPPAKMGQAVAS